MSIYNTSFNFLAMICIDSTLKMWSCCQVAASDATGNRRFLLSIYAHGLVHCTQGGVPLGQVHCALGGSPYGIQMDRSIWLTGESPPT